MTGLHYILDRRQFEGLRVAWFEKLKLIADAHPALFPLGVLTGIVLGMRPAAESGTIAVSVAISPDIPADIAVEIEALFVRIFSQQAGPAPDLQSE